MLKPGAMSPTSEAFERTSSNGEKSKIAEGRAGTEHAEGEQRTVRRQARRVRRQVERGERRHQHRRRGGGRTDHRDGFDPAHAPLDEPRPDPVAEARQHHE